MMSAHGNRPLSYPTEQSENDALSAAVLQVGDQNRLFAMIKFASRPPTPPDPNKLDHETIVDDEEAEEADFESSTETDDSNEEVFLPSSNGEIRKNPARKGRAKTYAPES